MIGPTLPEGTGTMNDIDKEAWFLILLYAESGIEDDIDEDAQYTVKEYDAIHIRAFEIIKQMRDEKGIK